MEKDRELLSDRLAFRLHRGLKQLVLSILRKAAPTIGDSSTEGLRNVVERLLRQLRRDRWVIMPCVHPKLSQGSKQRLVFRTMATARQKIREVCL
jgi:hypothetical protein